MKDVSPPNWNENIRFDYPLDPNSIVIDAGMYEGTWSEQILRKFNCRIIGLEPVKAYYQACVARFRGNERVQVLNTGLGAEAGWNVLHVNGDATSRYRQTGIPEICAFRPLASLLISQKLDSVSLLKLNIEGSEYSVLENAAQTRLLERIEFLQVQFHDGLEYSPQRLLSIREQLEITHTCEWRWGPMTWESWRRRRKSNPT